MSSRQLLNRNSYVVIAALVLVAAALFVSGSDDSLTAWIAWLLVAVLLIAGLFGLRIGRGTRLSVQEAEHAVGDGVPVVLALYSNYCAACMVAKPVLTGMEKRIGHKVRFIRADVGTTNGQQIAAKAGLQMVPTFIGYNGQGEECWRIRGIPNRQDMWRKIIALPA